MEEISIYSNNVVEMSKIKDINPIVTKKEKVSFMFDVNDRKEFALCWYKCICDIYNHFDTELPMSKDIDHYRESFMEHSNITIKDLFVFKNCILRNKTIYGDAFYENKFIKTVKMRFVIDWWNVYVDYRNRVIEENYYANKNKLVIYPIDGCIGMPEEVKLKIKTLFVEVDKKETYIDIVDFELGSNWSNDLVFTDINVGALFYMCLRKESKNAIFKCADELVKRKSVDLSECIRLCGVYGRFEIVKYISEKL